MISMATFAAWFLGGSFLAGIYLAVLWVSVEWALRQRATSIWIAGAAARLALLIAAASLAVQLRPSSHSMIAATVGFLLVRLAVIGAVRAGISHQRR